MPLNGTMQDCVMISLGWKGVQIFESGLCNDSGRLLKSVQIFEFEICNDSKGLWEMVQIFESVDD